MTLNFARGTNRTARVNSRQEHNLFAKVQRQVSREHFPRMIRELPGLDVVRCEIDLFLMFASCARLTRLKLIAERGTRSVPIMMKTKVMKTQKKKSTTNMQINEDTCGFWLTIGFADPIFVLGSDVTTISSRSIGAPMIDCLAANELDTGRQTQVNILARQRPTNSIQAANLRCTRLVIKRTRNLVVYRCRLSNLN